MDSLSEDNGRPTPVNPPCSYNQALNEIEKLGRLKLGSVWDIIELYPSCVQHGARVVSSLPTTQVSVERMFSHLKLIMRENRARMKGDLADAILFLRMNRRV